MSETENGAAQAPKTVKVSEILTDLQNGLTRAEIATKLGLTKKELLFVFQNPKLKNKKTHMKFNVVIEDDTETPAVAPVATEDNTSTDVPQEEAPAPATRTSRKSASANVVPEESVAPEPTTIAEVAPETIETPQVEEVPLEEVTEKSPWDR